MWRFYEDLPTIFEQKIKPGCNMIGRYAKKREAQSEQVAKCQSATNVLISKRGSPKLWCSPGPEWAIASGITVVSGLLLTM